MCLTCFRCFFFSFEDSHMIPRSNPSGDQRNASSKAGRGKARFLMRAVGAASGGGGDVWKAAFPVKHRKNTKKSRVFVAKGGDSLAKMAREPKEHPVVSQL